MQETVKLSNKTIAPRIWGSDEVCFTHVTPYFENYRHVMGTEGKSSPLSRLRFLRDVEEE